MNDPMAGCPADEFVRRLPSPRDQDSHFSTDECLVQLALDLVLNPEELLKAVLGDRRLDLSIELRRRRAGPRREAKREHGSEADLSEQGQGLLEVVRGFTWKSDD